MASSPNTSSVCKKQDTTAKLNQNKTRYLRCRFCRTFLLSSVKLITSHQPDARECGNCLYLNEDELSSWSWLQNQIEQSEWTKGRLYCPKKNCNARIGGFDYVQGVLCSCGVFTVPAIWIHGKVDIDIVSSTGTRKLIQSTNDGEPTAFGPESKPQRNKKICLPIIQTENQLTNEEVGRLIPYRQSMLKTFWSLQETGQNYLPTEKMIVLNVKTVIKIQNQFK